MTYVGQRTPKGLYVSFDGDQWKSLSEWADYCLVTPSEFMATLVKALGEVPMTRDTGDAMRGIYDKTNTNSANTRRTCDANELF